MSPGVRHRGPAASFRRIDRGTGRLSDQNRAVGSRSCETRGDQPSHTAPAPKKFDIATGVQTGTVSDGLGWSRPHGNLEVVALPSLAVSRSCVGGFRISSKADA